MKKWKFKPIGSSVHTTKYLAFGKALLATLYLKVKVYIYKCIYLDFYVSEHSLDLENLPLLNIEWTSVLQFGFLDVLKLYFFTRCLYFHHNWRKQRGTNIKDVTKEKKLEIHKRSWLSIIELIFFLIGIHSMQGWTTTTRHGVTRKEAQKRLQDPENLFRKNLQLKDAC